MFAESQHLIIAYTYVTGEEFMKSSTKDIAEGKLHQVKGKIKEVVGDVVGNPTLEAEGKVEGVGGKIQEKIGHVKGVVDK